MSLQGSFQTIALTDVMALLAASSKTGELRVVGEHVEGRLWLVDGRLVASHVGKAQSHVEALFELMRLSEGNFVFKDGVNAPEPAEPAEASAEASAEAIEPIVRQAEERLNEWHDIVQVVPSLEHRVRLIADLPAGEVTLSAAEWHLVMSIALAGTVQGVLEELSLGQFDGCRGIRHLVDAGLVIIDPPRVRTPSTRPGRHVPVTPAPPTASAPVVAAPRPVVAAPAVAAVTRTPERAPRLVAAVEYAAASVSADPATFHSAADDGADDDEATVYFHPMRASLSPQLDDERDADTETSGGTVHHFPQVDVSQAEPQDDSFNASPFFLGEVAPPEPVPDALHDRRLRRLASATRKATPTSAAPAAASATEPSEGYGDTPGEPINRGLLLKFLSSVRS